MNYELLFNFPYCNNLRYGFLHWHMGSYSTGFRTVDTLLNN